MSVFPDLAAPEVYGPTLPTWADLDRAEAATRSAMEDPTLTPSEREAAALEERQVLEGYLLQPGAETELQVDAELQAGI
jgi:hypothetical protein